MSTRAASFAGKHRLAETRIGRQSSVSLFDSRLTGNPSVVTKRMGHGGRLTSAEAAIVVQQLRAYRRLVRAEWKPPALLSATVVGHDGGFEILTVEERVDGPNMLEFLCEDDYSSSAKVRAITAVISVAIRMRESNTSRLSLFGASIPIAIYGVDLKPANLVLDRRGPRLVDLFAPKLLTASGTLAAPSSKLEHYDHAALIYLCATRKGILARWLFTLQVALGGDLGRYEKPIREALLEFGDDPAARFAAAEMRNQFPMTRRALELGARVDMTGLRQ